jgi:hypothetical protein
MTPRILSFAALPLAALVFSLSSAPACGSSGVSCENPTSDQQTCLDCINSSCSAEVSQADSTCPSYVSCFSACNCGDTSCTNACGGGDAGDTCVGAAEGLLKCLTGMCASQCASFAKGL